MAKIAMICNSDIYVDARIYKEAHYLADQGHNVEVLVLDRKHKYIDRPTDVWKGFSIRFFFVRTEKLDRFISKSKLGKRLKYLIYLVWFKRFISQLRIYFRDNRFDFIHCHDEAVVAGYGAVRNRIPIVFDMHEDYEVQHDYPPFVKLLIRNGVRFYQKKSFKIIYVHDKQLRYTHKKIADRLVHIPNYPDLAFFVGGEKTKSEKIRINYIGTVRQLGMLKLLFNACKNIEEVEIGIYGDGPAYSAIKEMEGNYYNVKTYGRYDNDKDAPAIYSNTDILFCAHQNIKLLPYLQPVKFFEAIATRTLIIACKGSYVAEYSADNGIGFSVDLYNESDIRELILNIVADRGKIEEMRENFKNLKEQYDWSKVVTRLDVIYGSVDCKDA